LNHIATNDNYVEVKVLRNDVPVSWHHLW